MMMVEIEVPAYYLAFEQILNLADDSIHGGVK
jgi:hypothetical protein